METMLDKSVQQQDANPLFEQPLEIVNIGLEGFADELAAQGVEVTHLDWRPPAGGDAELANLLSKLGS